MCFCSPRWYNITLFNSCINFTNVHLCNYCTKIFVIVVNTCVCRRSVDNKALILSYPILSYTVSHFSGKFSNSMVKQLSATKTKPWYPALFVSWFLLLFISVVNYGWITETTETFLAKIGLLIDQTETNSYCGPIELKNTFAFSSFNGMFWIWVFF